MFLGRPRLVLAAGLLILSSGCADTSNTAAPETSPESAAPAYERSVFVPGSNFHGIHGIIEGPDGYLYAGSVVGQAVYKIDPASGEVSEFVSAPEGSADDLVFDAAGNLYFTDILRGQVRKRSLDGSVKIIADDLPGANAIDIHPDGRLFVTQVFQGDALNEIDPDGEAEPRVILSDIGGLNGFEIGDDGYLYGPLWFRDQIVKVDVDSAEMTVLAEGIETPTAANFLSSGRLLVTENISGDVISVDIESGEKLVVARGPNNPDNLAITSSDEVYVTYMSDNAIGRVNQENGSIETVVKGGLAMPADIAIQGDELFIADTFSLRKVSLETGEITDIERLVDRHEYPLGIGVGQGVIATTSWSTNSLQVYDIVTGESQAIEHDFSVPFDVAVSPRGTFYVAEFLSGCVKEVTLGEDDRPCIVPNLLGPVSLALAENGVLYVSESLNGQVTAFDTKTGAREVFLEGLSGPEGLAIDGDYLIVAEQDADRIIRVSLEDRTTQEIGTLPLGMTGVEILPPTFALAGVATRGGRIYASSDIENAIYEFEAEE